MAAYYVGLLIMTAAFMAVLAAQWVLSKGDPAARAVVRWVGLTTLVGSGALTLAMVVKQAFGGSSLGGDGLSIVPMFVVYGGIAFGVGRYRLFDLDRWAFKVIVGAIAAAALLLADAGLILGLKVEARAALGLSIVAVGYLYFPVRTWLWGRIASGPKLGEGELFQMASDVAFLPSVSGRRARWRALLQRLFDPLEIALAGDDGGDVAVGAEGAVLHIPAAADERALVLRYRGRGRLLFDSGQAALARGLVRFMHHAERTRDEYARGAAEERQRIARDLHDDVSGRLLTGLRRAEAALEAARRNLV
jgi:signal transduction histidine kinase